MLTFGSLFSGIGGFDLGFMAAGLTPLWQIECDQYAQKILSQHFPTVTLYQNITTVDAQQLPTVDIICGGFPCQDISNSGPRSGLSGSRSGLWTEFFRIVRCLRPLYVVIENAAAISSPGRGLSTILEQLASIRYDAEWQTLQAADVGAPHIRQRLFMVAYPSCQRSQIRQVFSSNSQQKLKTIERFCRYQGVWSTQPPLCTVAHGFSSRVHQIKTLGNAVVPQLAFFIALCIIEHHNLVCKEH